MSLSLQLLKSVFRPVKRRRLKLLLSAAMITVSRIQESVVQHNEQLFPRRSDDDSKLVRRRRLADTELVHLLRQTRVADSPGPSPSSSSRPRRRNKPNTAAAVVDSRRRCAATVVRPRQSDDIRRQNLVWQVQEIVVAVGRRHAGRRSSDKVSPGGVDEVIVHSSSVYIDQRPRSTRAAGVVRFNGFRPRRFSRTFYCQLWYDVDGSIAERQPIIVPVGWI